MPLLKDVSNNISIDLSSYVLKTNFDLSFNNLQNIKQDNLTFQLPLSKDVSNNITIDLSAYVFKQILIYLLIIYKIINKTILHVYHHCADCRRNQD